MTGGFYLELKSGHKYAITAETLDKIVKAKGDEIVVATYRRKKLKKCNGYRKAQNRAIFTFSEISGAVRNNDGTYSAKLRIKFVFLLLLLLLAILLIILFCSMAHADETDICETTTVSRTLPDIAADEETSFEVGTINNFYINVPGIKNINISNDNRSYSFFNPESNICCLKYEIYIDNTMITETSYMLPGQSESNNIYGLINTGKYKADIIVKTQSIDGSTEYNSVKLSTLITVK